MAFERSGQRSGRDLQAEWRQLAAPWIQETRAGRNAVRERLLDGPMIEACGNVQGQRVLDCGCGEGRFGRILAGLGAKRVLGVDLCPQMIEAARELATGKDSYAVADAQDLRFLGDETFDLTVSYLNQCYLPDVAANNREIFRVLRPGGRLVVANLHPMRSAADEWESAGNGAKRELRLDRYFEEGERRWNSMGIDFTIFHRTIATYTREYRCAGFSIEGMMEPAMSAETPATVPEEEAAACPSGFIIVILEKPASG